MLQNLVQSLPRKGGDYYKNIFKEYKECDDQKAHVDVIVRCAQTVGSTIFRFIVKLI